MLQYLATQNVVTMDIAAILNILSSTRSTPPNILGTLVLLCEIDILSIFGIYESHNQITLSILPLFFKENLAIDASRS